ncbi:MAG: basic amino acid ABC transporter substrate-binding protein [Synergistaceae bacterium]|jgi:polar amino acid transport system substrate-binding protein|nr:basic amino acid ABC transporter substrate-binding protein [Synergistaceae bacterium]
MRKILVIMAAFVLTAIAVSGAFASVMDKGVVTAGTEGTYPPFEFYDDNNVLTGFDVELLALIGPKIGREIRFVDMAFDGLIPALLTGKIDLIAAAMNATEERRKVVDFSDVYQVADASVVTRTGGAGIKSMADLKGRRIGVQLGTTEDLYLSGAGLGAEIKRYQKTNDAIREILLDRIDGVLLDTPVANGYITNDRFAGFIEIAFKEMINGPEEGFSFALRRGDSAFLDALNGALRELEESGELDALKVKYGLK